MRTKYGPKTKRGKQWKRQRHITRDFILDAKEKGHLCSGDECAIPFEVERHENWYVVVRDDERKQETGMMRENVGTIVIHYLKSLTLFQIESNVNHLYYKRIWRLGYKMESWIELPSAC